jgi:hypothetical protein
MTIALDHLLLLGLLCASSHWVFARSKIMQPLWSRATGWFDALLRCAGCSGFWLGLGWRFAGVSVCSGWVGLLMNSLLGAIITPVFEAVLLWGLEMTAVSEAPRAEVNDKITPSERPVHPSQS